ncbi:MAG: 5'-nucleotidase C-terminal domain-containing protein [Tissierellia bacterium]|nr:5'-nucleotidase C-terminal domain-containing protein [Tissierellia bacterium]
MKLLLLIILFTLYRFAMPSSVHGEDEKIITILATADVHGRILPWDYTTDEEDLSGSLAQIATLVKEIREEGEVLLLDGGDLLQGNSAGLFHREKVHPGIKALNLMEYDAWTIGNHEFDFGMEPLYHAQKAFQGMTIAGNLFDFSKPGLFPSYGIFEKDGISIGVIGMTTPMVEEFKKETDLLHSIHITDPVEEVRDAILSLKGKVHAMVGLFHMGLENENGIPHTGVRDIIEENPELDVVIAAHMHQLYDGVFINNTLVGEPGKFATHLLRMDLTFCKKKGQWHLREKSSRLIPVAEEEIIAPCKKILTLSLPYHLKARRFAGEIIGRLVGNPLVPDHTIPKIPIVQIEETPLTDWISQVMKSYSGAMVVAHQIDNDDAKMDPGVIRKKDIFRNYQYMGGEVTVYQITGRDLKDYMEWSAGYFNRSVPGDITISFHPERRKLKYSTNDIFGGLCYTIDLRRPKGQRIVNLSLEDGTIITEDMILTIGVNAYRMGALLGPKGPLEGRNIKVLYSTGDQEHWGNEGKIQNLMMKDIRRRKGKLEIEKENRWEIIGPDLKIPGAMEGLFLLQQEIIEVPSIDGATNISSVNLYQTLQEEEIQDILYRSGLDDKEGPKDCLAGEFYQWVYNKIKTR